MVVYHGSQTKKSYSNPNHHRKVKKNKAGVLEAVFDGISFHASKYKSIALAYTYSVETFRLNDWDCYMNVGIDLNDINKPIEVYGYHDLDYSLGKLYGKGGFIHTFNSQYFKHKKGLGDLELVTNIEIAPLEIEYINSPVEEMKKYGLSFRFINLELDINARFRRFKDEY